MNLAKIYPEIKKSIVAFIPKFSFFPHNKKPKLPPILGTGFFINDKGLIATNAHVVNSLEMLKPKSSKNNDLSYEACAVLYYKTKNSIIDIIFDLKKTILLPDHKNTGYKKPDLAFVEVNVRDNPYLELEDEDNLLKEGYEIATSGFPMGRYALMGPGGLFQISPTLQRGIISAILPYPKKKPDAFAINIMTHGGASGSPVFSTETGKVRGVLFSILTDTLYSENNFAYTIPTNISYAVPCHHLRRELKIIEENIEYFPNKIKFNKFIENKI
ncbi:MAG: serine protease [Desulforegulaceae bacterium]|nr:serine protease [Desulforegulaceae bacterium]